MFYFIFRRYFLKLKSDIERQDAALKSKEVPPANVVRSEYAYRDDGHRLHRCNLYAPEGAEGPLPLIIDIHGGAWICGDKDTNNNFNCHLAARGFRVSALSYRTVDECTIAEQIKDVFDYFSFLYENRERLNVATDNVILTGDSAGAQLALLAYRINREESLQRLFGVKPVPLTVKCMALNHGVCFMDSAGALPDNPALSRFVSVPGLQRIVYGRNYKKNEKYLRSYRPDIFIQNREQLPPILLITSRGYRMYLPQTYAMRDFLEGLGADFELYCEESEKAEHVFNILYADGDEGKKCNDHMAEFFRKYC